MTASDWFWLVVLSLFWGGSFFFGKVAVAEIPPLTLALGRVAIAAAALLIYLRIAGIELPAGRAVWISLALMSVVNNVLPFSLIYWGQQYISSSLSSILNASVPLFTIVVAHFATLDDRITPLRLCGLLVGFLGVIVVVGPEELKSAGIELLAQLAALLGAFCYAISGVYGRKFRNMNSASVSAGVLLASILFLAPLSLFVDQPWHLPMPGLPAIGSLLGVALISTSAAYLIYFHILARAGATNLLLVTFLVPVSAILLGSAFLHEKLSMNQFIGMVIIAFGLALIDGRPARWIVRLFRKS